MLHQWITQLLAWYSDKLQTYGAPLVGLMMGLESTIVPIPSEVIIPPAAHFAYGHPGGKLTIAGIIIAGTVGSWIGATIMYWTARLAGRPLMLRYGSYVLISPAKIEGSERWAKHFGPMGVFISRLLPVVRHLIGIPAGLVKMDFRIFSLFTVLGSGIWCGVLCWLGIKMGQDEQLMEGKYKHIVLWLAFIMAALGAIYYFFVHRHMKAEQKTP
jgi:membrane protein DedA with SNARE-associated domain